MDELKRIAPLRCDGPLVVGWCIEDRRVLIVGGGNVATRRVRAMLQAGAQVTVVAPELDAEIRLRVEREEIVARRRAFESTDLDLAQVVVVTIDDPELSRSIAVQSKARGLPVHVADVPELCDFIFPALLREGPLQVAVSTGGSGPALAARIRDRILGALPARLGEATRRFGLLRKAVRAADPDPEASKVRMRWLTELAHSQDFEDLAELSDAGIARWVKEYMCWRERAARMAEIGSGIGAESSEHETRERTEAKLRVPQPSGNRGRLRLVGAGPGDPALLTQAAHDALREADLVLSDRLVSPAVLELAQGELRMARKIPGRADEAQAELDRWMVEALRAGRDVVRLKCGDPFLFGRGGEELETLERQGVQAEVIPGLTSALAAPASIGIPTTLRGVADRVLILSGHGAGDRHIQAPDFVEGQTYLFLMALSRIRELCAELRARGFPADLPAAVVANATWEGELSVKSELCELPRAVHEAGIHAPAIVILGRVVAHAVEPARIVEVQSSPKSSSARRAQAG